MFMGRSLKHRGNITRSLSAKETMHEYPHLAHHRRLRQGRRTQVLGVTTALSAIALWGVGDMSLADLLGKLPIALGGLGLLEHDPFRKAALTFPDHAFV